MSKPGKRASKCAFQDEFNRSFKRRTIAGSNTTISHHITSTSRITETRPRPQREHQIVIEPLESPSEVQAADLFEDEDEVDVDSQGSDTRTQVRNRRSFTLNSDPDSLTDAANYRWIHGNTRASTRLDSRAIRQP